jgi:DNA repair protein RadD
MELRPYQRRTIDQIYKWLGDNSGHLCVVLPTGSGKSVVIAEFCREAVQSWPETRILMLSHVKELIEQNADKMRKLWPNAPLGIYSASIGLRELSEPITFAGIQSIHKRATELGHVDLILIDEAHTVGHKDEGTYRSFISDLEKINPALRIIGFTATPYRLGHGLITDKPAIFDDLIEPATIVELQALGFLAKLRSKDTKTHFDLTGVHKRGGEYIESELQAAVDTDSKNRSVVDEIIIRAENRRSWIMFCAGVDHALHIRDVLREKGINAETITGQTPTGERDNIISDFRSGKIKALTNANVLTTGFDAPNVDLIAFLRPTESPGLYVQMAGRGLRLKEHTDHCLILDFAGLIERHGPITGVLMPEANNGEKGVAPSKACPECDEIVPAQTKICPSCGFEFPIQEKEEKLQLRHDDIMGMDLPEVEIKYWDWQIATSRSSGKEMVVISYYPYNAVDPVIKEYLCLWHEGFAGKKARELLKELAKNAGVVDYNDTAKMERGVCPAIIKYQRDGKFFRVMERIWEEVPF